MSNAEKDKGKTNSLQLLSLSDLDPPKNCPVATALECSKSVNIDERASEGKIKRTPSGNTVFHSLNDIKKSFQPKKAF